MTRFEFCKAVLVKVEVRSGWPYAGALANTLGQYGKKTVDQCAEWITKRAAMSLKKNRVTNAR